MTGAMRFDVNVCPPCLCSLPQTIVGTGSNRRRPKRLKRFQDFLDVFATNGVGMC